MSTRLISGTKRRPKPPSRRSSPWRSRSGTGAAVIQADQFTEENPMTTRTQSPRQAGSTHGQDLLSAAGVSKRYGNTLCARRDRYHGRSGGDPRSGRPQRCGQEHADVLARRPPKRATPVRCRAARGRRVEPARRCSRRRAHDLPGARACPDLTVAENIALSSESARGWSWKKRAERQIAETLDRVFPGHGISIVKRTSSLSSMPQRQMVEIARAMCTPKLSMLILDEPTESLSMDATRQMYAALHELAASGVGMVLISHRMQEVLANADRIAVMKDGKVVEIVPAVQNERGCAPRDHGRRRARRHRGHAERRD